MCGIIGYVGKKNPTKILIDSLKKLEYRGYDSAGLSLLDNDNNIVTVKSKGKVAELESKAKGITENAFVGIAHNRWATHGEPSDINAHPHLSNDKKISVVHNGIIENYKKLKNFLIEEGYEFLSETDTEVIPNLISYFYKQNNDIKEAVYEAIAKLEGSYALNIICKDNLDMLIGVRKDSPLIIGKGTSENFLASDTLAVSEYTKDVYYLEEGEMAVLTSENVVVYDTTKKVKEITFSKISWDTDQAKKQGYDHFMIKEVNEEPKAYENIASLYIKDGKVEFDNLDFTKEYLDNIKSIHIVACGTAYHAGLVGDLAIENLALMNAEVFYASEYRYMNPLIDENTLFIAVSQSGETADTLQSLKLAKEKGAKTLTITNVVGCSMARESEYTLYTCAGPEIAVASTKAYTTQVLMFNLLALYLADIKGCIEENVYKTYIKEFNELKTKAEKAIKNTTKEIKEIAEDLTLENDLYYIGRFADYMVAQEASLKIKEISYVHSEALAAGELKHGTLALITDNVPVIAIMTSKDLVSKTLSNVKEIKARGGDVIAITSGDSEEVIESGSFDKIINVPETLDTLSPVITVIPLQLLAYYSSTSKGINPDQPRNLAKSVTVE